jgi:hypothetical protein
VIHHNVRLKRRVADVIETTDENQEVAEVEAIAPKPVFFNNRLLNACTA